MHLSGITAGTRTTRHIVTCDTRTDVHAAPPRTRRCVAVLHCGRIAKILISTATAAHTTVQRCTHAQQLAQTSCRSYTMQMHSPGLVVSPSHTKGKSCKFGAITFQGCCTPVTTPLGPIRDKTLLYVIPELLHMLVHRTHVAASQFCIVVELPKFRF